MIRKEIMRTNDTSSSRPCGTRAMGEKKKKIPTSKGTTEKSLSSGESSMYIRLKKKYVKGTVREEFEDYRAF